MNKFKEKAIEAEALETVYNYVEEAIRTVKYKYGPTGEMRQKQGYDTDSHQFYPIWEDDDEDKPVMEEVWGDVEKDPDEFTEEDSYKLIVYKNLLTKLEKML